MRCSHATHRADHNNPFLNRFVGDGPIKEKMAAELDAAGLLAKPGAPPPRDLEYADLTKLTYLNCTLKEGLRMHCAAPMGSIRQTRARTRVGPYTLPANTIVWVAPGTYHRSK